MMVDCLTGGYDVLIYGAFCFQNAWRLNPDPGMEEIACEIFISTILN